MSHSDSHIKVMQLNEPGGEMLDTKYYCKVDKRTEVRKVHNIAYAILILRKKD